MTNIDSILNRSRYPLQDPEARAAIVEQARADLRRDDNCVLPEFALPGALTGTGSASTRH